MLRFCENGYPLVMMMMFSLLEAFKNCLIFRIRVRYRKIYVAIRIKDIITLVHHKNYTPSLNKMVLFKDSVVWVFIRPLLVCVVSQPVGGIVCNFRGVSIIEASHIISYRRLLNNMRSSPLSKSGNFLQCFCTLSSLFASYLVLDGNQAGVVLQHRPAEVTS